MGVPKFFRYISERYPCLSELVKDYQIPEFDNLYLDMNGIIHNCSHPNDDDPHFRITEEKIFQDIFHYIEVLFRMIKPQKLFFMAVDGVAPRAKMNQQRGRRFRSAADAAKAEAEAIKKGESLPTEARFDSNCITPGTEFMAKLHEQLKYFVVDKISNDPLWQKCKVILSGHETPGEGEHKIMDYIRYMRVQPGYDPNTRHCLYGLDADLIMLGLCTHEPHFSLLREEVKFGRKNTKRITVPEEITFFLLHLSLLREYLELEFASVRFNLRNFDYDFEKVIDDWVLMGFLVGNDFIPHLPNLHINEGALPILYQTYMDVLPTLNGYINEEGTLNLKRFEMFLQKLGEQDLLNFEQVKDDILYMESKTGRKQGDLARDLEEWKPEGNDIVFESLEPETFKPPIDSGLNALIHSTDELCLDDDIENGNDSDEDDFMNFKRGYYKEKLEYQDVTPEVLRDQAEGYVRAIQWNLNYYYNGCCSWSWFYPHHYAPYISDIQGFTDFDIQFDMGKPFHPYEQLLAVLPAASKELLPDCYRNLMTDENSIIIDYYPENFECDLNGKKQSWEAVVKIPFINEKLLLEAMSYCNDKLTTEEKRRNIHGPMLIYMYTPKPGGPYPSPCYFPEIAKNHSNVQTLMYSDILVPREKLIKGAYPGAHMDIYYPGFPTMKHLQYRGELERAHVKVFEQPSRNESMIVKIIPDVKFVGDMIPVDLLGTSVFVGWPHLIEAKVVSICNKNRKFVSMGGPNQYNANDLKEGEIKEFKMSISGITEYYKTRMGIDFGETKVLVHVKQLIGRKFTFNSNGRLLLEKQFSQNNSSFPLQAIIYNIKSYDPQNNLIKDVETIFPKNSICFTLINPYYGSQGVIQDSAQVAKTGRIKISVSVLEEPDLSVIREMHENVFRRYKPAHYVASPLCISNVLFSKITGTIQVKISQGAEYKRINVGLDLKLNKKNKETPGFTKKINNSWLYTEKTALLVKDYIDNFPEVLECLSRNSDDDITVEKLFPRNSDERFTALKQWLKSLPSEVLEKAPCNSISLEPDTIIELENVIDAFKSANVKKVTMSVKPNFLYRPEVQNGTLEPDPKTVTELLDRIVNVRHGYTVPYGFKGTITAIRFSSTNTERDTMYEVIFDKPFRDGLKLNSSDSRGYTLPKTAFINISYGQRLMVEKTGKPDDLIARAEASNSRNYNNQNQNNYFNNLIRPQPSFQQQWFPSQQPPLLVPQTHPSLNQPNSAFAHFASSFERKPLHIPSEKDFSQFNKRDTQKPQNSKENKDMTNIQDKNKNPAWRKMNEFDVDQFFSQNVNRSQSEDNKDVTVIKSNNDSKVKKDKEETFVPDSKKQYGNKNQQSNENPRQHRENHQDRNKTVNYFMPDFGDDKKSDGKDSRSKAPTVNTDFLKNILGIGRNEEKGQKAKPNVSENKETSVANLHSNGRDEVKSSNVSFDMLASQVAKTPASVQLLTYYQSNQLGLPRYQYFQDENKMIRAQISLNDGKVVTGEPSKTREEASEKVATVVLNDLLKKYEKSVSPQTSKENPKFGKSEATAVLNNSFVPLQAVKSHISKSNSAGSSTKSNEIFKKDDASCGKGSGDLKNTEQSSRVNKNTSGAQKQKKERKTRIAAKFLSKD